MYGSVHLLYYKCHKICFKRIRSQIDSLDCMKNKKTIINKKDRCFQYAVTIALNHDEIQKISQRII